MMRNSLFLILALALLFVPVFLVAHAFTHFVEADAISITDTGIPHVGDDHDIDIDDICLDCLALTGLSTIFAALGFLLHGQTARQLLVSQKTRHNLHKKSSPHCPRGPPLTSLMISNWLFR